MYGLTRRFLEETINLVGGAYLPTVHCKQILAIADVYTWLSERRAQRRIPVLALVDVRESVTAVLDMIVGAEQSAADGLHIRPIPAAHINVLRADVAQHVGHKVGQIRPAHEVIHVRLVSGHQSLQIDAVQVWVIKEVPFDAPYLAVYLIPLGTWIDVHLHLAHLQRSISLACIPGIGGFPERVHRLEEPLSGRRSALRQWGRRRLLLVERIFGVEREIEVGNVVQQFVRLPSADIEFVEDLPVVTAAVIDHWRLEQVE